MLVYLPKSYLNFLYMGVHLYCACLGRICFSSVHKNLKADGRQIKYQHRLLLILHTCVISLIKKAFAGVKLAFFQIASFFSAFSFLLFLLLLLPGDLCLSQPISHDRCQGITWVQSEYKNRFKIL